jgi:hypothetical protein
MVSGTGSVTPTIHPLAFARQFLIGPRRDPRLAAWPCVELGRGLVLQHHGYLPCARRAMGERRLTMVGFMLDAARPAATTDEILGRLLDETGSADELLAAADALSGRWVLIYEDPARSLLLHDAAGFRTVVHTVPGSSELWCASQTGLIADQLGLRPDTAAQDFWETLGRNIPRHVRAWPGAGTAFAELRALLPNHHLDLRTGEAVRFFPRAAPAPISLDEGTARIAAHLRGSLAAAQRRYRVHQQITAGLDSRTMLAASREHRATTTYFTCLWPSLEPGMTAAHRDIAVPARLLTALGLPHTVHACGANGIDPDFARAYAGSDTFPVAELLPPADALARVLPADAIVINNNVGELGRCYLHPDGHPDTVSLSTLCNMHWTGLHRHPYLVRHLGEWLEGATQASVRHGYRLLDLFHWEMKAGRRVARGLLQLDAAHDTFSPFACRKLAQHYLAVPELHRRRARNYELQHAVIRTLWPETLDADINPVRPADRINRVFRRMRRHARRVGLPI